MMVVTVYSTESCPYCVMAKDFLKEKKVRFKNVDVGSDRAAAEKMVALSGQLGVPVIVVGKKVIVGFDKAAISRALKAAR